MAGAARLGLAWRGKVRHGMAGKAWTDMTGTEKTKIPAMCRGTYQNQKREDDHNAAQ